MKKFVKEFKEFINRGNVMDLAVGMIIGSAFTAIVTALTNGILKPIINWIIYLICGGSGTDAMYTVLVPAYITAEDGTKLLDTANAIFIDWGSFLSAIINFLLIALVLFSIIKTINKIKTETEKVKQSIEKVTNKQEEKVEE